jgi:PAS domain S-box-containing protein
MAEDVRAHALLQETLLGEALDNLDAGVFLADEQGRYVAVNRFACTLTGYSREELLGMTVHAIAADASDYEPMLRGAKSEGVVGLRRKDGSIVLCEWRSGTTKIAGMTFYVGLNWPAVEPSEHGAPSAS